MARAGKLRHRATFERATEGARDASGNKLKVWGLLLKAWCDLRQTPGREVIASGRPEAKVTGTLRFRANATTKGILPSDRVKLRGEIWSILSHPVDVDGRDRLLEVIVERGGAED